MNFVSLFSKEVQKNIDQSITVEISSISHVFGLCVKTRSFHVLAGNLSFLNVVRAALDTNASIPGVPKFE